MNAISYTLQEPTDCTSYIYLTFHIKDLQGSNTHRVTLIDANGKSFSAWVDIPSVHKQWTRINTPLSMFSSIDLSCLTEIRIGEWNRGAYLFDNLFLCYDKNDDMSIQTVEIQNNLLPENSESPATSNEDEANTPDNGDHDDERIDYSKRIAVGGTGLGGIGGAVYVKENGIVVCTDSITSPLPSSQEDELRNWSDIVAVTCSEYSIIGIKADGTVVRVGLGSHDYGQYDMSAWRNIVDVATGYWHNVGLRADGTVVALGRNKDGQCTITDWRDIVDVACGTSHTVGLKADGTLLAAGSTTLDECNVSSWSDIIDIACGSFHTVGLKSDGTVIAVGSNYSDQCEVSGWENIIAIDCGSEFTAGLTADGTVYATDRYIQYDARLWNNIIAISCEDSLLIGLKSDGTVVTATHGKGGMWQDEVAEWDLW